MMMPYKVPTFQHTEEPPRKTTYLHLLDRHDCRKPMKSKEQQLRATKQYATFTRRLQCLLYLHNFVFIVNHRFHETNLQHGRLMQIFRRVPRCFLSKQVMVLFWKNSKMSKKRTSDGSQLQQVVQSCKVTEGDHSVIYVQ